MLEHKEYLSISSEIHELTSLLASIPKENVMERMGLEARLEEAETMLSTTEVEEPAVKARLTFRGQPVWGTRGIVADFASKAVDAFSEAVAASAAGLAENLRYMGPIPDREKNQLLITGTAIGSFGFEFEVPPPQGSNGTLFPDEHGAEAALEKVQSLFKAAATGSDDDVAELVDEIHPRAVRKVADFLEYMTKQKAWCALEFKQHTFRFHDLNQLSETMNRLREDNIQETSESYSGELQGVLPKSRTFEFKISNKEEIIRGKIGSEITDADILRLNQEYLYQRVNITLQMIQVGQGRPRFTLQHLNNIKIENI